METIRILPYFQKKMMVQENQIELGRRWLEAEEANQGETVSFSGDYKFSYSDRIRIGLNFYSMKVCV